MEDFGYTRLNTFQRCPKKHDYIYTEGIKAKQNIYIMCGSLFHQCIEGFYKGDTNLSQQALDQFKNYVKTTSCELDPDLLEYVFTKYVQYYAMSDKDEDILCVETEFTDNISEEDRFVLRVDRIVYNKKTGSTILRDTKTTLNKLKYTFEEVNHNAQLLTYIPFVEEYKKIHIDQIEIDEVRLCKLQDTPINANGKPTADKRRLELTTYENYMDTLESMNLADDKAYQGIIDYMEKRGHPMFNRISAQVLDPMLIQTNMNDMFDTYKAIKSGAKYRIRGPLCNYCDYKGLCDHDSYSVDSSLRDIEINKIIDTSKITD